VSKILRNWFASHYKIDLEEADRPLADYANIHELFVRRLKKGARPLAEAAEVVSPVDGVLSQTADLGPGLPTLIQAKNKTYTLAELLRDEALASRFVGGSFATIYLAPFNYHRIHSPIAGELVGATYCPGTLWPVNQGSVERIEGLFAINERLATHLRTYDGGEMLLVKVGATNVGRIVVNYTSDIVGNAPPSPSENSLRYDWQPATSTSFCLGEELGRFEMGSTVILVANRTLYERNPGLFHGFAGQTVRVGQLLCDSCDA
jgi:phosphatidylserine decarboxylase